MLAGEKVYHLVPEGKKCVLLFRGETLALPTPPLLCPSVNFGNDDPRIHGSRVGSQICGLEFAG